MGKRKTVLYVQRYPDGGSITSLLGLIRGLDPARYRAVVAFATPNAFLDEFADAGAAVEVLRQREPVERPHRRRASAGAAAPTGSELAWWRGLRRVLRRAVRHDIRSAVHLARVSRRHHVDIIHGNNDLHINRDAALASSLTGLPLVNHARGFYEPHSPLELQVDRAVAHRAARVFFISHAVAAWHAPLRLPPSRTRVVDNPFAVEELKVAPSPELRASLGFDPDDRIIINIGRITPMKGQELLIRALPQLLERDPSVRVLLIGAATDPQGDAYEQRLHSAATELGVTGQVVFAGARRDVAELLAISDIAVHSSTEPEPFGRVIVEAMAAGRPVVASDEGGVPEIIDDGVTGVLVRPADVDALAAALGRLLDDPAEAEAMGQRAVTAANQRFSAAAHASQIQAAYDDVLSTR
jgi:glycosyltransferase involved in cell wall biosynthesis